MDWREPLGQEDPTWWEESYRKQVLTGTIADEEWWCTWLSHRFIWPSEPYSLFNTDKPVVQVDWMGTVMVIQPYSKGKERVVMMQVFGENPYHPDFDYHAVVSAEERRFPSIGNPFIDEPNYKQWERWLFAKLLHVILEDQKGLSFLVDRYRQQFHQQG